MEEILATIPNEDRQDLERLFHCLFIRDDFCYGLFGGKPVYLSGHFTFFILAALPVVTNLNPAVGPFTGGTVITITGSGFTGTTSVNFGPIPAASFIVSTDTTLTATSPAHAPQVIPVTVTTPSGRSATSEDTFLLTKEIGKLTYQMLMMARLLLLM